MFLTRNSFIRFIARSDCVKFSALNETIGCETRKEIMMCGKEELRSMGNGERHSKKRAGCVIQEELYKGFRWVGQKTG